MKSTLKYNQVKQATWDAWDAFLHVIELNKIDPDMVESALNRKDCFNDVF